jgi:hypothetical protein
LAERRLAFMLEKVDRRPTRELERTHFSPSSRLRKVVEVEPDWIPLHEIMGKIMRWETLIRNEPQDRQSLYGDEKTRSG